MSKIDAPERSRTWMWIAVVVLAALHQDFWWWDTRTLVFGILPIGLFYHMLFSLAAAALWIAAVKWAWPSEVEVWADQTDSASPTPTPISSQDQATPHTGQEEASR